MLDFLSGGFWFGPHGNNPTWACCQIPFCHEEFASQQLIFRSLSTLGMIRSSRWQARRKLNSEILNMKKTLPFPTARFLLPDIIILPNSLFPYIPINCVFSRLLHRIKCLPQLINTRSQSVKYYSKPKPVENSCNFDQGKSIITSKAPETWIYLFS